MATSFQPVSPQQSRGERPRPVTTMSYASNRSRRSSHSQSNKVDLVEASDEKRRLKGKADPTKALHEAQPAAVAQEDSMLEDLRITRHKDAEGNVINDPDRSNPTRHRMERPLDTIRAFNAAAEGTSSRRSSYQRPQSQYLGHGDMQSRRSSYYGSSNNVQQANGRGPRPVMGGGGGYYRQSVYGNGMSRPHGFAEEDGSQHGGPRSRHMRNPTAPSNLHGEPPSPNHSHHYSYETGTSGSDENSKSTNPSSQNSSFDQIHQADLRKPEDYAGQNGYPRQPNGMRSMYPPTSMPNMNGGSYNGYQGSDYHGPPVPPPKQIIRLGGDTDDMGMPRRKEPEVWDPDQGKRKSWIKRTFSRR